MKQLLCYGDSNTWGLIPGTRERYPRGIRWTGLLQQRLSGKGIHVLEEGLCGRTCVYEDAYRENRSGVKLLPTILESHAPVDAAVLMLGTNDCKAAYHLNAVEITAGLELCLNELLRFLPPSRILLVSPIVLGEDVWKPEFDPEFNQQSVVTARQLPAEYRRLANKKGVPFMAASDYAEPGEVDREHMTVDGHAALAGAIYKALAQEGILAGLEADSIAE